jgi:NADP-dependent 3-hydroxy acid dehydrogenase YdfG
MICIYCARFFLIWFTCASSSVESLSFVRPPAFLIVGGTGKVGSSVASHILYKQPNSTVILAGRNAERSQEIINQLKQRYPKADVRYQFGNFDQRTQTTASASVEQGWKELFSQMDCVIHTAGPYVECRPAVLKATIAAKVPVYVDVSDPLPYLERCVLMSDEAKASNTTALIAAGAYPGMSNVLAVETAAAVMRASQQNRVKDIRFNFFAAGLGGIGTVNLYITNVGFGDPIGLFDQGKLRFFTELSGKLLGNVQFYFENATVGLGNEMVRERVGTKQVFAWPFPEGATVPLALQARGSSSVAMGVAPDIWNSVLGMLVSTVPRPWWRNDRFSRFMADFSQPLVLLTDQWMKWVDPMKVGETHAMRIDIESIDGSVSMSNIQAHDSLKQCVGQSCAEFAFDCLEYPTPGVFYPEQRYEDESHRHRIIEKLTNTPGTFCYTGPVKTDSVPKHSIDIERAINSTVTQERNR